MEYEYSFNVLNIDEYIKYCEDNNYINIGVLQQTRTIYKNENGTIARITIEKQNDKTTNKLDFKEDKLSREDLIVRKESEAIIFDDIDKCENILEFLNYKKNNTLIRERFIYELNDVKFEIDNYIEPKSFVIAIEGKKEEVDKVYNELENTLNFKLKIK